MGDNKFEQIRLRYPGLAAQTYLNSPLSGLLSNDTYEAIRSVVDDRLHNGLNRDGWLNCWEHADSLRPLVARVLAANEDEIFFDANSSSAFNVLSAGLDLRPGSNVVTSELSYAPMILTWENQLKRGVELRRAPEHRGRILTDELIGLCDENTSVISICGVESYTGYLHDIRKIGKFCKENDIVFAVDATQYMGVMNIDVQEMHIDFLTASTYKWLNNVFGLGVGFVSRSIMPRLNQVYMGWAGNNDRMKRSDFALDPSNSARRFENGSLNWLALAGLEQSAKTYLNLGAESVETHVLALVDRLYSRLAELPSVSLTDFAPESRSSIVRMSVPGVWGLSNEVMEKNNVAANFNIKSNDLRVGFHFYNNEEDLEKFMEFLYAASAGTIIR